MREEERARTKVPESDRRGVLGDCGQSEISQREDKAAGGKVERRAGAGPFSHRDEEPGPAP